MSRAAALLALSLLIPACNFTFSTDDSPGNPQAPQNPFALQIPVDGSSGVLTSNTQFAWSALPGAVSYTLQISLMSGFSEILYEQTNILIPSVFVSIGLTRSSTYYWRVYGLKNGSSELAGGSPYRFTTLPPPGLAAPSQFFLQSPVGGPIDVQPAPAFLWTISPEAMYYTFQLDTSNLFLSPLADVHTVHYNRLPCPIPLANGTTYYWRVTAVNTFAVTASSPVMGSFVTSP